MGEATNTRTRAYEPRRVTARLSLSESKTLGSYKEGRSGELVVTLFGILAKRKFTHTSHGDSAPANASAAGSMSVMMTVSWQQRLRVTLIAESRLSTKPQSIGTGASELSSGTWCY